MPVSAEKLLSACCMVIHLLGLGQKQYWRKTANGRVSNIDKTGLVQLWTDVFTNNNQQILLCLKNYICLDRNTNCSYSFCPPGRTGSRSDVHKPICGPGSEEHPPHLSHPQMCCFVKAFCFWNVKSGDRKAEHTHTTIMATAGTEGDSSDWRKNSCSS